MIVSLADRFMLCVACSAAVLSVVVGHGNVDAADIFVDHKDATPQRPRRSGCGVSSQASRPLLRLRPAGQRGEVSGVWEEIGATQPA